MNRASSFSALRAKVGSSRYCLPRSQINAYAQLYASHGASHELTISLGIHPKRFEPEVEFLPQLRRVAKELSHQVRGLPKRQMPRLDPRDAIFMGGFYEATDAAGLLFPHWHGVIALAEGEERIARSVLAECVGEDKTQGALKICETSRPVITTPKAKPTFHLQPLKTPEKYISYASKKAFGANPTHWTTWDFLRS